MTNTCTFETLCGRCEVFAQRLDCSRMRKFAFNFFKVLRMIDV